MPQGIQIGQGQNDTMVTAVLPSIERSQVKRDDLTRDHQPSGRVAAAVELSSEQIAERTARRFLAGFAIAFATTFGLVWIYVAAMPMAFLTRDYPAWIAKGQMLTNCELGSVTVFGDSRAMAGFEPSVMPIAVSNFATSGGSPIEGYFLLRRALRCKKRPSVVVISYSVGKFTSDNDYWNIGSRIGIFSFRDMIQVQKEAAALHDGEIESLRRDDHLAPIVREGLFAVRFPAFYFDSLVNGYVFLRYLHNRLEERRILADRGQAFFGMMPGSDGHAAEVTMRAFMPSPLIDAYFRSMLVELSSRNIPVAVVSAPLNESTCAELNPSVLKNFVAYLRAATRHVPGVQMVGPTMPCWPNRLFGDQFHLNAEGANQYSKMVGQWLQSYIALSDNARPLVER